MNIINTGYNYIHDKNFKIDRPSGTNDYIFLAVRSPWYFVLNNDRTDVLNPSVFIFKKGTAQHYGALTENYINDWIHFELDDEDLDYFAELKIKFNTPIEVADISIFSNLIKSICHEQYSSNIYSTESGLLYFKLLLLKLSENEFNNEYTFANNYYYSLSKIRNKIYSSAQNKMKIDDMAKELKISRSYLQHIYKKQFGVCIMDDITNSRLNYAKYLLFSTDMSISEIAFGVGYNNDVHFMRLFKKYIGITPTAYRKLNSQSEEKVADSKNKNPFSA